MEPHRFACAPPPQRETGATSAMTSPHLQQCAQLWWLSTPAAPSSCPLQSRSQVEMRVDPDSTTLQRHSSERSRSLAGRAWAVARAVARGHTGCLPKAQSRRAAAGQARSRAIGCARDGNQGGRSTPCLWRWAKGHLATPKAPTVRLRSSSPTGWQRVHPLSPAQNTSHCLAVAPRTSSTGSVEGPS